MIKIRSSQSAVPYGHFAMAIGHFARPTAGKILWASAWVAKAKAFIGALWKHNHKDILLQAIARSRSETVGFSV
jgi:hypothetical protein